MHSPLDLSGVIMEIALALAQCNTNALLGCKASARGRKLALPKLIVGDCTLI